MSNSSPFPSDYEQFIYTSRYAKWREEDKRRETWGETVDRLMQYYQKHSGLEGKEYTEVAQTIYHLEVMPSMRALMSAGPALDRCHVPAYNCAYLPVDSLRSFDESMYILMCGTGVGFSVEKKYVDKLPVVAETFNHSESIIVVGDSKEGWARSFRQLVSLLYSGEIPRWDMSNVRPAGARLKTFGGRASGPKPLDDLFTFSVNLFTQAAGRRLTSLEAHDLMCKIADIVVVGGVRRSAMISLSDVTDERMRKAKSGAWWEKDGQRRLANNSAVYENRKPDMDLFMKEWYSLYESKSGERGFFSRSACENVVARSGRRETGYDWGTNPCSEIILRPYQFCNLSSVVVRATDTVDDLLRKTRIAAILGTIQSTFTDFKYLRKIWKDNCNEERLLGVSLNGICDNIAIFTPEVMQKLKENVVQTNKEWAERLGIPQSAATTCVKPEGTTSQKVNCASGMHTRFAPYYLRTVRADNKDPLTQFLQAQGVPYEADVMNPSNTVFYFPQKSPDGAITRNDQDAIQALELWKLLQDHWCEHKPSVTVNVKEDEWMKVGSWVYENFDKMSGVSFLPYDGGSYKQAPYQEIDEATYNEWVQKMPPKIDWMALQDFEQEDNTTGSQELACVSGVCEIISIGDVQDG